MLKVLTPLCGIKSRQEIKILDGFSFFRQADARMKTEHDPKLIRCPKLGDEMTFAYCLREAGDLPCADCSMLVSVFRRGGARQRKPDP